MKRNEASFVLIFCISLLLIAFVIMENVYRINESKQFEKISALKIRDNIDKVKIQLLKEELLKKGLKPVEAKYWEEI